MHVCFFNHIVLLVYIVYLWNIIVFKITVLGKMSILVINQKDMYYFASTHFECIELKNDNGNICIIEPRHVYRII